MYNSDSAYINGNDVFSVPRIKDLAVNQSECFIPTFLYERKLQ